ncbi:GDP-mannose-dependent alpha-(1-6)-phosphatidylinositol monomannoside mannosyltransferase [compost metagenome]
MAGGGDMSYLKKVANKFNVTEKVKFLGPLTHEQVFEYLNTIDIYAQPSRQEGLPRALIEAMSKGVPSIGSTTAGIPELLEKEFIFNNGNIKEICEILKKMKKETMAAQAEMNYVKSKEFSKDILNERRTKFYNEFSKGI